MTPYGKIAQAAISAMSLLAEQYATEARLNSRQIAQRRKLSQPIVGKVLTGLSQAGLVEGTPGPGGGYRLALPPAQIRLLDIASLFDRLDDALVCPFGPGWCGTGPHCPLHDDLVRLREQASDFLRKTTLAAFTGPAASD